MLLQFTGLTLPFSCSAELTLPFSCSAELTLPFLLQCDGLTLPFLLQCAELTLLLQCAELTLVLQCTGITLPFSCSALNSPFSCSVLDSPFPSPAVCWTHPSLLQCTGLTLPFSCSVLDSPFPSAVPWTHPSLLIAGIPAPVVRWYLGSREIRSSRDFYLSDNGHEYSLRIAAVSEVVPLKGVTVAARNSLGEDRRKVDIRIYRGKDAADLSTGSH